MDSIIIKTLQKAMEIYEQFSKDKISECVRNENDREYSREGIITRLTSRYYCENYFGIKTSALYESLGELSITSSVCKIKKMVKYLIDAEYVCVFKDNNIYLLS